ncbi:hypothetical protein BHE74_00045276 [Ensete ventricosum]|nr:hypothetical protein BHE74_00045276 [Ensete ventricosum]
MAIGRMRYRACMPCDVSTNSECSAGGGVEWEEEEEAEARMAAGGSDQPCCSVMFWVYLMICLGLVMFAGLMSGLTLGLMSLSLVDLEVLVKAGKPKDQLNAAKILPVVKNQHLLLCTLLIGNSLAMEVSAAPLLSSVCPRMCVESWFLVVADFFSCHLYFRRCRYFLMRSFRRGGPSSYP